jgi:hypothetical protein
MQCRLALNITAIHKKARFVGEEGLHFISSVK